jgi:hypothetical protein
MMKAAIIMKRMLYCAVWCELILWLAHFRSQKLFRLIPIHGLIVFIYQQLVIVIPAAQTGF